MQIKENTSGAQIPPVRLTLGSGCTRGDGAAVSAEDVGTGALVTRFPGVLKAA